MSYQKIDYGSLNEHFSIKALDKAFKGLEEEGWVYEDWYYLSHAANDRYSQADKTGIDYTVTLEHAGTGAQNSFLLQLKSSIEQKEEHERINRLHDVYIPCVANDDRLPALKDQVTEVIVEFLEKQPKQKIKEILVEKVLPRKTYRDTIELIMKESISGNTWDEIKKILNKGKYPRFEDPYTWDRLWKWGTLEIKDIVRRELIDKLPKSYFEGICTHKNGLIKEFKITSKMMTGYALFIYLRKA